MDILSCEVKRSWIKMAWALRWHSKSLLIGLLRVVTLMVSRVNRLLSGPGCDASPILETETGKHPAWHEFKKKIDASMQMRQMHVLVLGEHSLVDVQSGPSLGSFYGCILLSVRSGCALRHVFAELILEPILLLHWIPWTVWADSDIQVSAIGLIAALLVRASKINWLATAGSASPDCS